MKSSNELRTLLRSIDRKSYPAYKALSGAYQFGAYVLVIDHVQGDPFASPSSVHIEVSLKQAGFPEAYYQEGWRISLPEGLEVRWKPTILKLEVLEKAGCCLPPDVGRRFWREAPVRLAQERLLPDFILDFRHSEEL